MKRVFTDVTSHDLFFFFVFRTWDWTVAVPATRWVRTTVRTCPARRVRWYEPEISLRQPPPEGAAAARRHQVSILPMKTTDELRTLTHIKNLLHAVEPPFPQLSYPPFNHTRCILLFPSPLPIFSQTLKAITKSPLHFSIQLKEKDTTNNYSVRLQMAP